MATFRFKLDERTGVTVGRPPVGVRMLGPNDSRLRAEVKFRPDEHGGLFTARTVDVDDAALRVQVNTGQAGTLVLQTCLLPPREEPYDLTLELARHRVKTFIVKSEDWQMFDPALAPRAVETFEHARHTFTDALLALDPLEQGKLAGKALQDGLRATDRLAHSHADILLHRRYANRPASSTTLGTTVDVGHDPDDLAPSLKGIDVITVPLRWRDIEVHKGRYDFSRLDAWMQWAHGHECPVILGPLANLEAGGLPDWVEVYRNDYPTLRNMMFDFMEAVVARYIRTVGIWKVVSGLHLARDIRLKPAEMIDLTRTAILLVRQYRRGARTMIEVDDLFGDQAAKRSGSIGAFEFLEQIRSEGIRFDCLGARLQMGGTEPSERTRDLMTISDALDRFFLHEVPVLLSACGAPCRSLGDSAGSWRDSSWSPERQAEWASRIVPLALSKPYVEAVIWSMHKDSDPNAGFGLLDASGARRPAHEKLLSMRRRLRRPLGPRETQDRGEVHHQQSDA